MQITGEKMEPPGRSEASLMPTASQGPEKSGTDTHSFVRPAANAVFWSQWCLPGKLRFPESVEQTPLRAGGWPVGARS